MNRLLMANSRMLGMVLTKGSSQHLGVLSIATNRWFSELGEATGERLRRVFREYAEAKYVN